MLNRVYERRPTYNNTAGVANSAVATLVKVAYYRMFGAVYFLAGKLCDVIMVNSNWTKGHLDALWGLSPPGAAVVFPPCNTDEFQVRASVRCVGCERVRVSESVCV